jgi:hypothetical protein
VSSSWLGLMELFVGAAVVLGWAVIELVILRRDKRRAAEQERSARAAAVGASAKEGGGADASDQRPGA